MEMHTKHLQAIIKKTPKESQQQATQARHKGDAGLLVFTKFQSMSGKAVLLCGYLHGEG